MTFGQKISSKISNDLFFVLRPSFVFLFPQSGIEVAATSVTEQIEEADPTEIIPKSSCIDAKLIGVMSSNAVLPTCRPEEQRDMSSEKAHNLLPKDQFGQTARHAFS